MAFDFKFPDVGEGITEGEIVKFLVKEGDQVKEDQVIAQIETDKAVVDIPSPKTGTILKLNFKEGDKIQVGQVLATIGEQGEKTASSAYTSPKSLFPPKVSPTKEPVKGQSVVGQLEEAPEDTQSSEEHMWEETKSHVAAINPPTMTNTKILTTPAIRALAKEKGIDLTHIIGSGPSGRILKEDLDPHTVPQQKIVVKKKYDDYGYIERVPLKGIRKSIANAMNLSRQVPQVTIMEDINAERILKIKDKEKLKLAKDKIKLTLLPFIIKAAISSLSQVPVLNASLVDEEILIKKYFNIGIAVETDLGLMVPVIKIAQNKTIPQLANEISSLSEKCRSRTIDIMDLQGGTFTITNFGSIGGTYATPLLNPGESSILGLGKLQDRVTLDKNNKFSIVKVLPISLTFDHRIADGAQVSRFLESLKNFLENPEDLLLELK